MGEFPANTDIPLLRQQSLYTHTCTQAHTHIPPYTHAELLAMCTTQEWVRDMGIEMLQICSRLCQGQTHTPHHHHHTHTPAHPHTHTQTHTYIHTHTQTKPIETDAHKLSPYCRPVGHHNVCVVFGQAAVPRGAPLNCVCVGSGVKE